MPRIMGIDIPREKRIEIAMTYIYGIGRVVSNRILAEAHVSPDKRAKDLTDQEVAAISGVIQKNYKVEGDLRREFQQSIKRLMDIKCYRGTRHIKGLPVRGQRSHTNARTRKGPRKMVGMKINKKAPSPS
ncbi:MAG: 30S ribosomal protein S13 [Omnitrophica bacterium GWA2_50_21]|nr:MAG: 30S ribosomal protein S13 [Omnitrophica bacterium GWA2_50_21]